MRYPSRLLILTFAVLAMAWTTGSAAAADPDAAGPLTLVVMDPLAAPLACDCVQGYAQRKYEVLGNFLSQKLHRPVRVYWSESLVTALEEKTGGKADLVIGKHSVVLFDAQKADAKMIPAASLTDPLGGTTQTGLIVVRAMDKAQKVEDLQGYRIFFGPEDCDEKSLAPMALLRQHGVALPGTIETYPACSNAATKLVELESDVKAAAVISSYAGPLLEGCGTIKKGDLRVIGVSEPVAFVTAFVNAALPDAEQAALKAALLEVGTDADLLIALETASGFVEYQAVPAPGTPAAGDPAVSQVDSATTDGAAKKKN
ncbi:MAG: PhnD/SsuA/transferrin family substrate-binding protein [Planctomycetaceae bacterium]|nr:PhnD/SsuA/transferrin family substrate-binding protein [Planctomycetaceae bacterium]